MRWFCGQKIGFTACGCTGSGVCSADFPGAGGTGSKKRCGILAEYSASFALPVHGSLCFCGEVRACGKTRRHTGKADAGIIPPSRQCGCFCGDEHNRRLPRRGTFCGSFAVRRSDLAKAGRTDDVFLRECGAVVCHYGCRCRIPRERAGGGCSVCFSVGFFPCYGNHLRSARAAGKSCCSCCSETECCTRNRGSSYCFRSGCSLLNADDVLPCDSVCRRNESSSDGAEHFACFRLLLCGS